MAIVVESTSTVSADNADTLTIAKPTGVAVGDTLLLITNSTGTTYASCTGFTQIVATGNGTPPGSGLSMLYRTADASDVSASNYTVNLTGTQSQGGAVMMRVSGIGGVNPYRDSATASDLQDASSWTVTSSTIALTRPYEVLLVMGCQFSGDSNSGSFSNYTVTSGVSNPTWTEVFDVQYAIDSQPKEQAFAVAYAITGDTSDITQYSVGVSAGTSGTADGVTSFLAVLIAQHDATADIEFMAVTPTVNDLDVTQVNQGADVEHLTVTPTLNDLDTASHSPTVWTNESVASTTWTNETL